MLVYFRLVIDLLIHMQDRPGRKFIIIFLFCCFKLSEAGLFSSIFYEYKFSPGIY